MARFRRMVSLAFFCLLFFSSGCGDDGDSGVQASRVRDFPADVAVRWFDLSLDLVRETPGLSPPVASRAFGYMGVTLYEALVPGMPDHRSLTGQLNELPPLPQPQAGVPLRWPEVANAALASIVRDLFPTATAENLAAIDDLEGTIRDEESASVDLETLSRSEAQGRAVAEAVFEWSKTDGGHEGYLTNFPTDYVPPQGDGLWVPTPPGFQRALQPYWGSNRTFALGSGAECAAGPPPPFSENPDSAFYEQANEVYETGNGLTEEQREIALFWSDDPGLTVTPPGHSISILSQILTMRNEALDVAAEGYARVGTAIADAFIACWNTKYQYNLIRPVTYIREWIDPDWQPIVNTPPFPEYTSGHSIQSGAAAQVLTDLFGPLAFTDHTHDERGLAPRSFESFFDAAGEAALSRLYGGIHYRAAIEIGLEQGKCVGATVSALRWRSR